MVGKVLSHLCLMHTSHYITVKWGSVVLNMLFVGERWPLTARRPWVDSPGLGPFCVNFAFSPCICVNSLWIPWLLSMIQKHVQEVNWEFWKLAVDTSPIGGLCLSLSFTNLRLIHGVTLLSPEGSWDILPPTTLSTGQTVMENCRRNFFWLVDNII